MVRFSPEFEDCRRVAGEHRVPLAEVYEAARLAYRGQAESSLARNDSVETQRTQSSRRMRGNSTTLRELCVLCIE